jgi:hypothetical protein
MKCQGHIHTTDGAKSFSMQRIRTTVSRQCSRQAKETVAHLQLCATHARLAREGFMNEDGIMMPAQDIADTRNYRGGRGPNKWAEEKKS